MQEIELTHLDCTDCPIRHRAVCARCDSRELDQLEEMKYYRTFEAGQTIAWTARIPSTRPGASSRRPQGMKC